MKRVLITGENSYIGTSVAKWLEKSPNEFEVTTISVRGDEWKNHDFSQYDTIFHVAGIAHQEQSKEVDVLHWKVNYELTKDIAKKAKESNVYQFVFLSSMSIFGDVSGEITTQTGYKPTSEYGKSKCKAEEYLRSLTSDKFLISIVRPPMVYGYGCKGNYTRLSRLAKKTPLFADVKNIRSMIFIENLALFIELLILQRLSGTFHPQNSEYINTSSLVKCISQEYNRKIYFTKLFNPIINISKNKIDVLDKVFGSLYYSRELSNTNLPVESQQFLNNQMVDFKLSIKKSELGSF